MCVQAHAIDERVHDINLSHLATETIVKVIIILQVSASFANVRILCKLAVLKLCSLTLGLKIGLT